MWTRANVFRASSGETTSGSWSLVRDVESRTNGDAGLVSRAGHEERSKGTFTLEPGV